jgi:hypothetical protein
MSGLAALLAGRHQPGIYRWTSAAHVPDVQHAVEHAGWTFAHLDGWTMDDSTSFLTAVCGALSLEGQAANFDMLSDLVGDVHAGDTDGVLLLWDGWAPFARADEQAFSVALSVLGTRVHADRGGPFSVVLRGDGPELDLPELVAVPA